MIKKTNIYLIQYLLLASFLLFCGCGNDELIIKDEKNKVFVMESIPMSEYEWFDCAWSDGNYLYYAAGHIEQLSEQYISTIYKLDLRTGALFELFSLSAGKMLSDMVLDSEGNFYLLSFDSDSKIVNSTMRIIYKINQKGIILQELDLEEFINGQDRAIIQKLAVDRAGSIILIARNNNIFILNPDGSRNFEILSPGQIYSICESGGRTYLGYESKDGSLIVKEIDYQRRKLSDKQIISIHGSQFGMSGNQNGDLIISTYESAYYYNFEENNLIKLLEWKNFNYLVNDNQLVFANNEKDLITIGWSYTSYPIKANAAIFKQKKDEDKISFSEKKIVIINSENIWHGMRELVHDFNELNDEYKIEIKTHGDDFLRLQLEIITGNGPDILMMRPSHVEMIANTGVFEDLNYYFDADERLNRNDFHENIFNAFETQGHLYGIPVTFSIQTIIARSAELDGMNGWNIDEFIAYTERFPDGKGIFESESKFSVFRLLKKGYNHQLVNAEQDNPLNRELLEKIIKFSNQYENDERYVHDPNLRWKIIDKQISLLETSIFQPHAFLPISSIMGESVTAIGYPSEERNGNLIASPAWSLSICSDSEYKDIAWKFISYLLSEEVQESIALRIGDLPVRKSGFERLINRYIEIHNKENWAYGYFIGYDDGFRYEDYEPNLTEDYIKEFRNLVESAELAAKSPHDIDKIINEEVDFYFKGIKSLDEVMDVIENRVRTYVNENR